MIAKRKTGKWKQNIISIIEEAGEVNAYPPTEDCGGKYL